MIFLDASAAAKRYFLEIGSDRVEALWGGQELVCSLTILHCELISVLNRKRQEWVSLGGSFQTIKKRMGEDMSKTLALPVDADLIDESLRLLDVHPLKTLDSLYLAGALVLQQALKEPVLFASADGQLLQAARAEGLRPFNPETGS